jgi:hypothetical protein
MKKQEPATWSNGLSDLSLAAKGGLGGLGLAESKGSSAASLQGIPGD